MRKDVPGNVNIYFDEDRNLITQNYLFSSCHFNSNQLIIFLVLIRNMPIGSEQVTIFETRKRSIEGNNLVVN